MKRMIKTFEADEDVARMLNRATGHGIKLTYLCNEALRRLLIERGFAGKKDLTFEPRPEIPMADALAPNANN